MKKSFLLLLSIILSLAGFSQTVTYDTVIGNSSMGFWPAKITRHVNHWQRDSVQGIIFWPGAGEIGNDVGLLDNHGPHYIINTTGWDGSVVLGNGTHYPVIVSLQPPNSSVSPTIMKQHVDIILNTFKIRRNGRRGIGMPDLHFCGISRGGNFSLRYVTYKTSTTDNSFANQINSMWLVQGEDAASAQQGSQTIPWPYRYGWWSKNFGGRLVYFRNIGNGEGDRKSTEYVKSMNDSMPGSAVKVITSILGNNPCGHCMFDEYYRLDRIWVVGQPDVDSVRTYDSSGTQHTALNPTNMHWAQWLLRNGDTTLVNSPPTVSAGADIAITLPTNSVTLNGSASDPDGSIVSYSWTKQSGGAATIASPNAATTVISGLTQGTYVFTLTAQDNHGGTGQDQVTVTVSPAPSVTKVINVSIDNVANYFKDPAWNSWHLTGNILSPATSQQFKYSDGSASTVTASITRQVLNNDNSVSYTGFTGLPDSALRYVSAHSNQRTLTIGGLDNAKSYNISLYSSRNAAGFTTKFTHGSTIIRIPTSGNKTAMATFSDIIPISGQIVIQIDSAAGSTNRYNHLNAFVITETPLIACAADAGPDIVAARGTGMVTLDGSSSFGGTGVQYKWTLLNTVDFDWKARIKKGNQKVATTQILPYVDGGYNFELAVSDNNGCIAKDTLHVMLPWGTLPPQSAYTNGWRRLLPGDAATINAVKGAGYAKADDIMIDGANAGTITGGKVDINLIGVSGLTIGPGTKIFIKAGNYRSIRMVFAAGQVAGSAAAPIIITNYDGQVKAQTFTMSNIKNTKMTGQYIAGVSGDVNFKGHADGNYAWSRGAYGFFLTMIGYPLVPQVSGLPGPPPIV